MHSVLGTARLVSPMAAGILIASIWQGVLLVAVVAAALRLLRGLTPAFRMWVWTTALLLVVMLPATVFFIHPVVPASHPELHIAEGWSVALFAVWAICACLRCVWLAAGGVRLWQLSRRAVPVQVGPGITALLAGRGRRAILCVSSEINRPSIAGLLRPRVLLPSGLLDQLSEGELEHVVRHEMEHLQRWDDWLNLLQQVSLVLLPLNPGLFWLNRRLCRERELACDDGVLQATGARTAYAACLVKLAEDSLLRKGLVLAMSALGAREADLVGRVRRILAAPERIAGPRRRPVMLAGLGLAVVGTAALLACSPAWISFDGAPPVLTGALRSSEPAAWPLSARLPQAAGTMVNASFVTTRRNLTARPELTRAVVGRSGWTVTQGRLATNVASARGRRPFQQRRTMLRNAAVPQELGWYPVRTAMTQQDAVRSPGGAVPAPRLRQLAAPSSGHLVVTGLQVSQPVYAAVPWQGGWLIVQL